MLTILSKFFSKISISSFCPINPKAHPISILSLRSYALLLFIFTLHGQYSSALRWKKTVLLKQPYFRLGNCPTTLKTHQVYTQSCALSFFRFHSSVQTITFYCRFTFIFLHKTVANSLCVSILCNMITDQGSHWARLS